MGSVSKKLFICLLIVRKEIMCQQEVWKSYGLKPIFKSKLTIMLNNTIKMLESYSNCKFVISNGTVQNVAGELVNNYVKNSKLYPSDKVVYLEEEEKTLPPGMFESYTKLCIIIEGIGDKYMPEMSRMNILENYNRIVVAFDSYKNFFEKEIIMTARDT